MRLVDLDDGDAGVLQGEELVVEDGDEGVDELVAGRVGLRGDGLLPEADSEQVGRGDADLGESVGGVYEEPGLLGDEAGVDDLHGLSDGYAPAPGFLAEVGGEAGSDVGDDVGVGVPAPLAVADEVESGLFLDGDGVPDGGVHAGGRGGLRGLGAGDVGEHVLHHEWAGEASDDAGGEGDGGVFRGDGHGDCLSRSCSARKRFTAEGAEGAEGGQGSDKTGLTTEGTESTEGGQGLTAEGAEGAEGGQGSDKTGLTTEGTESTEGGQGLTAEGAGERRGGRT